MKASLMIFPNDFNSLVNYFSFCMWLFHTATCFTVIIFRYTRPVAQFPRLFKVSHRLDSIKLFLSQVPLILPVVICVIGCYLIAVPFLQVSFNRQFLPINFLVQRNLIWDICLLYVGLLLVTFYALQLPKQLASMGHCRHLLNSYNASSRWCQKASKLNDQILTTFTSH